MDGVSEAPSDGAALKVGACGAPLRDSEPCVAHRRELATMPSTDRPVHYGRMQPDSVHKVEFRLSHRITSKPFFIGRRREARPDYRGTGCVAARMT